MASDEDELLMDLGTLHIAFYPCLSRKGTILELVNRDMNAASKRARCGLALVPVEERAIAGSENKICSKRFLRSRWAFLAACRRKGDRYNGARARYEWARAAFAIAFSVCASKKRPLRR